MNRVRQFVEFFDSVEFITVLITSLTTFVSVVGAYCILRIFQQRDQNYAELGELRVALAVYFDAANTSISMKDQLLKEMCGNYVLSRETYLRLVEEKRQPAGGQFKIPLDFRSLSEVRIVGNDEAVSLLADIDLPPMTMVAARIASRAADSKNNLIRGRNKFIDIWKENENIWSDK